MSMLHHVYRAREKEREREIKYEISISDKMKFLDDLLWSFVFHSQFHSQFHLVTLGLHECKHDMTQLILVLCFCWSEN